MKTTNTEPMQKLIRIRKEYKLLGMGYGPESRFPAGIYVATDAENQPDWEGYGKVFIENQHGVSLLLDSEEYEEIDGSGELGAGTMTL